jgi:hypothetical protein
VLVAPAIVAMSLGWHKQQEEADTEAAALAAGDKVAAAKAAASTAEFQSNTAGRIMCVPQSCNGDIQQHAQVWGLVHSSTGVHTIRLVMHWKARREACCGIQILEIADNCCRKRIGSTRNTALRLVAAFGYAAVATATRSALWVATPFIVQV